jgi:hypothetical protein
MISHVGDKIFGGLMEDKLKVKNQPQMLCTKH